MSQDKSWFQVWAYPLRPRSVLVVLCVSGGVLRGVLGENINHPKHWAFSLVAKPDRNASLGRVLFPPQPDGYRWVSSGLNWPKPAHRTAQNCFEVFSGVFIKPEKNTPKPAQTLQKSLAPNGA
jgi:hypothetical protein